MQNIQYPKKIIFTVTTSALCFYFIFYLCNTMAYLNYTAQDFASSLENRRPLCSFQVEFSSSIKWRIMWSLYHRYSRNVDLGTIIFHEFCFIFSVFFFLDFKKWKLNMINGCSAEDALPTTEYVLIRSSLQTPRNFLRTSQELMD